jgi:hypothetical protein
MPLHLAPEFHRVAVGVERDVGPAYRCIGGHRIEQFHLVRQAQRQSAERE